MKCVIISTLLLGGLSVFAQTPSVGVEEYKERVLEYSRQIRQSSAESEAMRQAVKAAKTAFFPAVDFNGSYQYRLNKYELLPGYELDHNTYSLGGTLSQPIYAGGQIRNNYEAAKIQGKISEKAEELTTDNVIYAADMNYWNASARKAMYDITTKYVEIIQTLADLLRIRFDDGQISKTDLLQVMARLKEAELNQSSAYKEYQLSLQNLNVLMGVSPMEPVELSDSINSNLPMPYQMGYEAALANRPEYSISELNIDYQRKQLNLSKAKYNPNLAVGFQTTWGTPMLNVQGSDRIWTPAVFASLKIPLFRWGARFKEVNSQKAMLLSKQYALESTRDQITQEVANAWTSLVESNKQLKVAEEACKIAVENLDLNTFSYDQGKLPILDVLSAQLSWIQSYSNLIQTWYQQKIYLAQYNKAVGIRNLK